jgi:ribosomal protein L20
VTGVQTCALPIFDSKVLADLAVFDKAAFAQIVAQAKAILGA